MFANFTEKKCTKCGDKRDVSAFNVNSQQKSGLNPSCKKCVSEAAKIHRAENKENISAEAAIYYKKNKAVILKSHKLWRGNNKERLVKWRAARAADACLVEAKRKASNKWYAKNSKEANVRQRTNYHLNKHNGKATSKAAKRRAIKLQANPLWANDEYIKLWFNLAKIEEKRTGRKVEVDHIVPLQGANVCGLHCEDNMQLLFMTDNRAKGNKFPFGV